ncbi:hypothetical protein G3570_10045 [Balneolaceae bacterium YR4-1]|uniref:Uncharacterized protein n=1 Tax=Halalkalibaculum roseum TaxID=2709311 RepID=A0A6M1T4Q8_9BACT|nr:FecR domain-containing protein [Halalkalibaculum roseum]NGP76975.1 hypothetical protein [Halalkalibaculum roseum]
MTRTTLPENDPDLQLARRIGSYLESETDLRSETDTLVDTLLNYRESREANKSSIPDVAVPSDEIWQEISVAIHSEEHSATIHKLGSSQTDFKTIWAVAASLLVAAFIGFAAYFYLSQQPQMIASSSANIETVVLEDGSKVTLRPHSSIKALEISANEHNYQLEGEAFFEVMKSDNRTFSVRAGNGEVQVLGTRFDLSNWGDKTQVYLEEGSIRFENIESKEAVTLSPGEAAEIGPDNLLTTKSAEITEYTDWMSSELNFRNKTTRYVFNEMEQEFNIRISAPDSIMNTRLSGSLALNSIDESLEDLSLVLDGQFIKNGDRQYIFVPKR